MSKYDSLKMAELVKAEESGDTLVLTFQGDMRIIIRADADALVSEIP